MRINQLIKVGINNTLYLQLVKKGGGAANKVKHVQRCGYELVFNSTSGGGT